MGILAVENNINVATKSLEQVIEAYTNAINSYIFAYKPKLLYHRKKAMEFFDELDRLNESPDMKIGGKRYVFAAKYRMKDGKTYSSYITIREEDIDNYEEVVFDALWALWCKTCDHRSRRTNKPAYTPASIENVTFLYIKAEYELRGSVFKLKEHRLMPSVNPGEIFFGKAEPVNERKTLNGKGEEM